MSLRCPHHPGYKGHRAPTSTLTGCLCRQIYKQNTYSAEAELDHLAAQLAAIEEYGTREINEAVELRTELAKVRVQLDEANERWAKLRAWLEERVREAKSVSAVLHWQLALAKLDDLEKG